MDRDEWVRRCAVRYMEIMSIDRAEADSLAADNAAVERAARGPDVAGWQDPVEAADEDMDVVLPSSGR